MIHPSVKKSFPFALLCICTLPCHDFQGVAYHREAFKLDGHAYQSMLLPFDLQHPGAQSASCQVSDDHV